MALRERLSAEIETERGSHGKSEVLREILEEIRQEEKKRVAFPFWGNWGNWGTAPLAQLAQLEQLVQLVDMI